MAATGPIRAAQEVKRTAALLRDVRGVLRKLDSLAATAKAIDYPATGDIAALRDAGTASSASWPHPEQAQQRRACEAVRRTAEPAPLPGGRIRPRSPRS